MVSSFKESRKNRIWYGAPNKWYSLTRHISFMRAPKSARPKHMLCFNGYGYGCLEQFLRVLTNFINNVWVHFSPFLTIIYTKKRPANEVAVKPNGYGGMGQDPGNCSWRCGKIPGCSPAKHLGTSTGWWYTPIPLKNDGFGQLGWWHCDIPNMMGKS